MKKNIKLGGGKVNRNLCMIPQSLASHGQKDHMAPIDHQMAAAGLHLEVQSLPVQAWPLFWFLNPQVYVLQNLSNYLALIDEADNFYRGCVV